MAHQGARARFLLVVGGGIAAYKAPELVRQFVKAGHDVQVVMTDAATAFVTEMALTTVSKRPVRRSLLDAAEEGRVGHIELADWAELIVVAPATANLMARAAAGLANDLATTVLLATRAPVLWAPAMNTNMWNHPATRDNLALLSRRGAHFVGPDRGDLACGWVGQGRMMDPPVIAEAAIRLVGEVVGGAAARRAANSTVLETRTDQALRPAGDREALVDGTIELDQDARSTRRDMSVVEGEDVHEGPEPGSTLVDGTIEAVLRRGPDIIEVEVDETGPAAPDMDGPWAGRRVVISAGPTRAYIDPVRFISNASTGAMGFELAAAAAAMGAEVTVVAGPVEQPTPAGVRRIDVETGEQMLEVLDAELTADEADLVCMVAAVADLVPARMADQKLDKSSAAERFKDMDWRREVDILATLTGKHGARTKFLGFAAQTVDSDNSAEVEERLLEYGTDKLHRKHCDALFVNRVGVRGMGFASRTNAGYLLVARPDRPPHVLSSGRPVHKRELARWILTHLDAEVLPERKLA